MTAGSGSSCEDVVLRSYSGKSLVGISANTRLRRFLSVNWEQSKTDLISSWKFLSVRKQLIARLVALIWDRCLTCWWPEGQRVLVNRFAVNGIISSILMKRPDQLSSSWSI